MMVRKLMLPVIFIIVSFASFTAFAQITITGSDISNMFAIGKGVTIHDDDSQSSVDIGSPGGGNNWNFTMLQSILTVSLESVDPASTPYIGDYPTADFCTYSQGSSQGLDYETWSYSTLNGYFDNLGSIFTYIVQGDVYKTINNPARHTFMNPTTFDTQFIQGFTQSLYINGTILNNTSVTLNSIVDAYGTMTLPSGASYDALRLREQLTFNGATTFVSYSFITKSGAQVNVRAFDSNPPNSGTINVNGTSYNSPLTTSVEQISGLPENFSLSQNYPNPFNPTTNIEYSIPEQSFVDLKVYDILGNEIAVLVNSEQSAGIYRADFTGANLASGFYIARLRAGSYTNTIKMNLLK